MSKDYESIDSISSFTEKHGLWLFLLVPCVLLVILSTVTMPDGSFYSNTAIERDSTITTYTDASKVIYLKNGDPVQVSGAKDKHLSGITSLRIVEIKEVGNDSIQIRFATTARLKISGTELYFKVRKQSMLRVLYNSLKIDAWPHK
ncbi:MULTISPECIES: hypothetical protein [Emticicia]|uniref:hypothetical protein n=1 Tax=Emticicia TaxID=312278 RepID=UPI00209D7FE6|nr:MULTISPECIES: hypothetical protein [Emticicia]UTA68497.1 hypothetical protein MB380_01515 [Emticicia sp. 21SJ11W-3]